MGARMAGSALMILGLARTTSASLRSRPGFVSLRRTLAVRPSTWITPPSQNVHVPSHPLPFDGSGCGRRIRPHSFLRSGVTSANLHTGSPSNDTEELEPFSWHRLVNLFRSPDSSRDDNYIPSDHPKLALFRRSVAGNALYLKHKQYLQDNWRSAYDYLVVSKFGESFGFRAVLCNKDGGGDVNPIDDCEKSRNGIPPQGYVFRSSPSLAEASKQTIGEGITYLKLVQNDFPYDVAEGIEHWCLWKIGGKSQTEGILRGELDWALRGLEGLESDGKSGISCTVDRAGEELLVDTPEPPQPASSIHDTMMWVNPPHLQSMPEIHHAHILVLRSEADGRREDPTICPPPI